MWLLRPLRRLAAEKEARLAIAEYATASGRVAESPWPTLIAAESENGDDAAAQADLHRFLSTPRIQRSIATIRGHAYLATLLKLQDGLRRAGRPEN